MLISWSLIKAFLLIPLLQALLLTFSAQAFAEPLLIAAEDDAEPWSLSDGSGFANDVVRAAFKAAGTDIQMEVMPYARCKELVLSGQMVAAFSMSWASELKGKVLFSRQPLFTCTSDYFVAVSRSAQLQRLGRLPRGAVLGVVLGYEYPPSVYALRAKGDLVFDEVASEEINLKKLALGRIDAALLNYNVAKPAARMLAKAGVEGKVVRAFHAGDLRAHIGFSRLHPRGAWALKRFDQGYQRIVADGSLRAIEQRWITSATQGVKALLKK